MKVEKIDHIAINVRNLEKATIFFANLLGTTFSKPAEFEEIDIRSSMDPLGIELVEPLAPDGVTAKTIERRGEGLSLLSLKVPNLEEAISEMESRGIRPVARMERGKMKIAIFHPNDTYGVMIELIEYETEHPAVTAGKNRLV